MNVLEKDLEDMLWQAITTKSFRLLNDKGLYLNEFSKYFRQFNFGSYGIADIVSANIEKGYDDKIFIVNIDIIELKKDQINVLTFIQSLNYARAAQRMVHNLNKSKKYKNKKFVERITFKLIGKSIESSTSFCYITDVLNFQIELFTYNMHFSEGVTFEQHTGFYVKNESLPELPILSKNNFLL